MGKASKWFRGLLGLKRPDCPSSPNPSQHKKWSLLKSFREKESVEKPGRGGGVNGDRAVAVAAASVAAVEAAVTAAHAAAAVVKLTSSGRGGDVKYEQEARVSRRGAGYGSPEEWAAVKIQSHFRAYLSRRALRALKALVRLQAMVRGHIVRKQNESKLRRWSKIFLRAQDRARAARAQIAQSSSNSNQLSYPQGPATPEKYEHIIRMGSTRRGDNMFIRGNSSKSNASVPRNHDKAQKGSHLRESSIDLRSWDQEVSSTRTRARDHDRSERILEIDNGRSHSIPRRRNLFHSSHLSFSSDQYSHSFTTLKESTAHQVLLSPHSFEHHALGPMKFAHDAYEESPYYTADKSPLLFTASSKSHSAKVGAFTPTKSDGSVSCLSAYSDHPNYMSYTESAKAKVRSLSAPKQRPLFERSSSTRRCLLQGYAESRINHQKVMQANFIRKAYPGSGRLDRLGMPIQEEAIGFSGGHWHPY